MKGRVPHIPESLPYLVASHVYAQGHLCDEIARLIRITMPGYLEGIQRIAEQHLEARAKAIRSEMHGL